MKLNLLLAALAATVVSALPAITPEASASTASDAIVAADVEKRGAKCYNSTFEWAVDGYVSTMSFAIDFRDGTPNYRSSFKTTVKPNDDWRTQCSPDGKWCVNFAGYKKSGAVTVSFGRHDRGYSKPNNKVDVDTARETYQYWDCIPA
ncbi:hypothetical protein BGZ95_004396 [Linnemannia exigua]|uniref:Uncharacterized protein n=1 Tax=Linnemannia exigua TaxID=604196 RepID=A0AAD4D315_9FUNG|nr:hypothetical protein BGZ95_004396 [Linnemannia exigua]